MQIGIAFADHEFTATLSDNPSARDFASMLPLDGFEPLLTRGEFPLRIEPLS